MGHRRLALAVAALLLLPAPAGAAGLRFRDAGLGSSISGDGTSVIAWVTPAGSVRVVTPDGRMRDLTPPCGGRFLTAGGGAVLFACKIDETGVNGLGLAGEEPFALQRLDGTPPFFFHGLPPGAGGERWEPRAMGRAWIAGSVVGYHVAMTVYRRRDGSSTIRGNSDPFGPRWTLDLDRRGLGRPLCRGVRRSRGEDDTYTSTDRWNWLEYDYPWALVSGPRGIALKECRRRGARTIPTGTLRGIQFGGGLVTWGDVSRRGHPMLVVLRRGDRVKRYRLLRPGVDDPA